MKREERGVGRERSRMYHDGEDGGWQGLKVGCLRFSSGVYVLPEYQIHLYALYFVKDWLLELPGRG